MSETEALRTAIRVALAYLDAGASGNVTEARIALRAALRIPREGEAVSGPEIGLGDEVERLRSEVASLRLTLGGRTYGATIPEPIGCPCPGACVQVAEIGRLRTVVRVNALRHGHTDAEIDEVLNGSAAA